MLSDDSSSESDSGRFKSKPTNKRDTNSERQTSCVQRGSQLLPDLNRSRINNRSSSRQFERKDNHGYNRRHSRDRYEVSRHRSPFRRRYSRDRSLERSRSARDSEYSKHRDIKEKGTRRKEHVEEDRLDRKKSMSPNQSCASKRNFKEEIKRNIIPSISRSGARDINQFEDKDRGAKDSQKDCSKSKVSLTHEVSLIDKNTISEVKKPEKRPDKEKSNSVEKEIRGKSEEGQHLDDHHLSISRTGSRDINQPEDKDRGYKDSHKKRSKSNVSLTLEEVNESDKNARSEVKKPEKGPYKEKSLTVEKDSKRKPEESQHLDDNHLSGIMHPTSYYNLTPAKAESPQVKETVHSITDSSEDEEKLRAKLLNLEKKLDKTKKRKSKKSKKKSKSKHKDRDEHVEVSSTTDIQDKDTERTEDVKVEVSSTARIRKDSSEEGEICSDEEDASIHIDPTDLRHRIKRSTTEVPDTSGLPHLRISMKMKAADSVLPSNLASSERSRSPGVEKCGPQLPPHMTKRLKIGPTLPSNDMRKVLAEASGSQANFEGSEDEAIGPLPAGCEDKWTSAHKKLEERALHMKIRDLDGNSSQSDVKRREEWMLELPEAKAKHIGLGPRQFRAKEGPDMSDRSSWTDTPQTKALKAAGVVTTEEASTTSIQREAHQKYVSERDKEQETAVKKHKKKHKREESLLEIHQKKLKKKKKKEEKEDSSARRPFSRDVDLQANRFDDAQKRSIIKKAQELDSRFSSGKAKFL